MPVTSPDSAPVPKGIETAAPTLKIEAVSPAASFASNVEKIADTNPHAGIENVAKVDPANPDISIPEGNGSPDENAGPQAVAEQQLHNKPGEANNPDQWQDFLGQQQTRPDVADGAFNKGGSPTSKDASQSTSENGTTPFPNTEAGITPADTTSVPPETTTPSVDTTAAVKTALGEIKDANKPTPPPEARPLGQATWKNADSDQPVKVTEYLGKDSSGREYVKVEGSETGIPLDEVTFPEPRPEIPTDTTPVMGTMSNDTTQAGRAEQAAIAGREIPTVDTTPINMSTDNTAELQAQRKANEAERRRNGLATETPAPGSKEERAALGIEDTKTEATAKPETDAEKQAKKQELEKEKQDLLQGIKDGSNKPEDIARVEAINKELTSDPQADREAAIQKLENGEELTPKERAALSDTEKGDELSLVEQAKLNQELEDLGTRFYDKMFNGEDAGDELIEFNKKLSESMGFRVVREDEQQAREFVKGILNPEKAGNPRETAKMRNIREKLQELGRMEMQLRVQAETVKRMNEEEQNLKNEVNRAEGDYVNENNPEEKQKKLAIFSGKSMHLARYQDAIKLQKGMGRDYLIKQRQARGYIHRKLGTKSFVSNVAFGTGTALRQGGGAVADSYEAIFDFA